MNLRKTFLSSILLEKKFKQLYNVHIFKKNFTYLNIIV